MTRWMVSANETSAHEKVRLTYGRTEIDKYEARGKPRQVTGSQAILL
jgi:hypothetical protein